MTIHDTILMAALPWLLIAVLTGNIFVELIAYTLVVVGMLPLGVMYLADMLARNDRS